MTLTGSCPVCLVPMRPWRTARDRTGGGRRRLLRCGSCGLAATSPAPAPIPAAAAWAPTSSAARWLAEHAIRGELRPLTAMAPRGARVLDVGGGSGERSRALAGAGYDVTIVEPDPHEAAIARARLDGRGRLIEAAVEALPDEEAGYDCALLSHVLEHLEDPGRALRAIAGCLRPGGIAVAIVPNSAGWEARAFRSRWHGWEPSRHRWHFTARSLAATLASAGFEAVDVRARGGWRYPASLSLSIAPGLDPQLHGGWRGRLGRAITVALAPVALGEVAARHGPQLVGITRRPL